jgi:hypothetical protein
MCFQVYFKPSHRCIKRKLESSAKTKASTTQLILRQSLQATLHFWGRKHEHHKKGLHPWYNLHSFIYHQRVESSFKRALMIPFLAIHAKGGESMSPKQKDRTTTNFKNLVFQRIFFNWYPIVFKRGRK